MNMRKAKKQIRKTYGRTKGQRAFFAKAAKEHGKGSLSHFVHMMIK